MARFDSLQAWLSWQEGFHPRSIDLGLGRAAKVFAQLNPHYIKPVTLTVAGTNGKGSCIAFLEAIYRAEGYKVGTYTSPHVLEYNERIKINGSPVSDDLICQAFERIDAIRFDVSLSFFEFGTLAALDLFSQADVDIQLLEVGLGGRLDAVNIIDPDVAIISSIGIDHVEWLGDTREKIACEKAGIFREGVPAIIGDTNPPLSLAEQAREKHIPIFYQQRDFGYQKQETTWQWYDDKHHYWDLPYPKLQGEHQLGNASVALLAVTKMQPQRPVSEASVHLGLQQTELMGRFQLFAGDVPVLLDVAHNPQAVKVLHTYLTENFPSKKVYAIFSMMKDKDINAVIDIMKDSVEEWIIAPSEIPRVVSSEVLKGLFVEKNINNVILGCKNFAETLKQVKGKTKNGDLILIFGSFFLVSKYLTEFGNA